MRNILDAYCHRIWTHRIEMFSCKSCNIITHSIQTFHSFSLSHSIVASILFFNLSEMSSSRSQIIVFFCAISKCNFVLFLQSWITVLPSPIAYPSSKYVSFVPLPNPLSKFADVEILLYQACVFSKNVS